MCQAFYVVLLGGLLATLVVLELAPIFAVAMGDGLWFMSVPEEFTATLWPPLKALLPGSYFYHYFGFAYYPSLRPAHWLTEWWLGSPEATIAYTQVYGTIIKAAFSTATLGIAIWLLVTSTLSPKAKIAVMLFMVGLLAASPDLYWIYHVRVSYALSVKLFSTLLLILTFVCAERALDGRTVGAGMTATIGAIGGALFFENLLYFPLVAYPTLIIVATTPLRLVPIRALLGIVGAILAALALLLVFFVGDIESIIAAISSHFVGLASGNPISQPGHYEQFVTLFLDRRSVYFACHIILVAAALVALATLVSCGISILRRDTDRTTKILGLLLVTHLANTVAYGWPLLKHPTYATVFATTIEALFFIIVTTTVAVRALRRLSIALGSVTIATAAIILTHEILPSQTWWGGPEAIRWRLATFSSIGALVRQFDDVLNELSDGYAVVDGPAFYLNDHVLYWQLLSSEVFNNTVAGSSGEIDERFKGEIQRERHPRYRFWQSRSVFDVTDRCYAASPSLAPGPQGRQWGCAPIPFLFGRRYANLYVTAPLEPTGEAWIEPLPADIAAPVLADRLLTVKMISYEQARGQVRAMLLADYPSLGLQGAPAGASLPVHWNIVPLLTDDINRLGPIATKTLIRPTYEPFLASVTGGHVTYHLLWLPTRR